MMATKQEKAAKEGNTGKLWQVLYLGNVRFVGLLDKGSEKNDGQYKVCCLPGAYIVQCNTMNERNAS